MCFIYRSLQIHEMTGVSHTRWLQEQRGQEGGDGLGGPLRYSDPCIFWLHADMEALDKRLDTRVDEMLSAGLIDELRDFHVCFNQQKVQDDRSLLMSNVSCVSLYERILPSGVGPSTGERTSPSLESVPFQRPAWSFLAQSKKPIFVPRV
ncbi:tRNA dimethylallyltransferase, mitochondrial-like [Notothenia coriiceps]|uniref:tRNA dimethylallyltransferase, mitochondrial-like n=1 Tax=Notothenia coriiceps TaxID=8208 RepID=A0A6I9PXG8_9TELE|nr:PREDICTED: tRNA dimethylallyltransferase, mitochondrial-like [Notothenia coriiceps]